VQRNEIESSLLPNASFKSSRSTTDTHHVSAERTLNPPDALACGCESATEEAADLPQQTLWCRDQVLRVTPRASSLGRFTQGHTPYRSPDVKEVAAQSGQVAGLLVRLEGRYGVKFGETDITHQAKLCCTVLSVLTGTVDGCRFVLP